MKIGLMLALGEDDSLVHTLSWDRLRSMVLAAEAAGLDSIWGADHLVYHGDRVEGFHESWTLLSAIAAITERVEIGPLVLAVPFRNPALTAKMASTLEEVSNGRLILGLGCGWHEPEFDAFDYPFDKRVGRFEEALAVMLPLLRQGRVRVAGRWHRADAVLLPRGPRPTGPPILIAGKGPRMLRLVARHADAWNAAWYGPPDRADGLDERLADLDAALAAEGRDPATLTRTVGVFVAFPHLLADTDEQPPENAMSGTADEVGRMLAGYRARAIDHLQVHLWPRTSEAVAELGRAADVARRTADRSEAVPQ
jgi:alkanesulfonate monooxygenase SsuD/methylene tetrahydromethanopterin reductase-like flavin-dependent oxidoreductase (luciferase family)